MCIIFFLLMVSIPTAVFSLAARWEREHGWNRWNHQKNAGERDKRTPAGIRIFSLLKKLILLTKSCIYYILSPEFVDIARPAGTGYLRQKAV